MPDLPDNPKPRPSGERKTVGTTPPGFYDPKRPGRTHIGRGLDDEDLNNDWEHDMEDDEDHG